MNNQLSDAVRNTRFNSSRVETFKDQKGTGKTTNDASVQLADSGFDTAQITGVLDIVSGNQLQRPWDDGGGWKPSFERPIKPGTELKPLLDIKPAIDLKPIIDKPLTDLIDIIKPGPLTPPKPFPGFPWPDKPIIPQPEIELADPGLTAVHNDLNQANAAAGLDPAVEYQDIEGEMFIDSVDNDGVRAELTDIKQGYVGDCYLCAALGSIALHNPEFIENMITDNGNGTYTVSFGGKMGDVTVDDDFAVYSNGNTAYAGVGDMSNPELWVAIIEKAYVQGNRATEGDNVRDGTYEGIASGSTSTAIANITGQTSSWGPTEDFTAESMKAALDNGQSVVLSSLSSNDGKKKLTPDGLVTSHAYVVSDVRQNADGEWELVVYNPWGSDADANTEAEATDKNNDGFTVLTMEEFHTNFRAVEMTDEPVG